MGIFTFNPNRRHKNKETNQEDLIINRSKTNNFLDNEYSILFKKLFVYAGALFAYCIVSNLPKKLKLSSIIWDYLAHEIDSDFKFLIQDCEEIQKKISFDLTQKEFENLFWHNFEISDSFDENIELIPSGSKTRVTRENLQQVIELAKFKRQNEFIDELKQLKEEFDKIISNKNIEFNDDRKQQMFWNVMKSFSVKERMLFVRFISGIQVEFESIKDKEDISNIKSLKIRFSNIYDITMHRKLHQRSFCKYLYFRTKRSNFENSKYDYVASVFSN